MTQQDKMADGTGIGMEPGTFTGTGEVNPGDLAPAGTVNEGENICTKCSGSGQLAGNPCDACEGTGRMIDVIGA